MYKENKERVLELVDMLLDAIYVIESRTSHIKSGDDFLLNPDDMFILDGVCMKLIFIGESVKTIDKLFEGKLSILYPAIPWKEIMKLRDIIAHHYFKIDVDVIYETIKYDLKPFAEVLCIMKSDLYRIY